MNARTLILSLALMAACTAGPESPERYRRFGPMNTLTFNFKDVPAHDGPLSAPLTLSRVYFQHGVEPPNSACMNRVGSGVLESFVAEGAKYHLQTLSPWSGPVMDNSCISRFPDALLFFKVFANVVFGQPDGTMGGFGTWTPLPSYDLVYAQAATVFMPFGPTGASVNVPEGYSWLHRTCGVGGRTELSIVPTSETLDLYRSEELSNPKAMGSPSPAEIIEPLMAAACGGEPLPRDLGTRVSFDLAKNLVWSADGASLFYLSRDEHDSGGMVGLRQVKLPEQTTSELAQVKGATKLQTGAAGGLFVTTSEATYAVSLAASAPATLQPLPLAGDASLSPDGSWFATDEGAAVHLWSVAAAAEVATIQGFFAGWSPDSRLLYGRELSSAGAPAPFTYQLSLTSPEAPDAVKACGLRSTYTNQEFVWPEECPAIAYARMNWWIESTIPIPACEGCFGVLLQNPVTGDQRQILDPSAGLVRLVDTHPVAGFTFAWVRTCLGLYNMVCSYSLVRIRLADGAVETVAVADQELPVALSWDNRRLALAASNGIYVKELPQ